MPDIENFKGCDVGAGEILARERREESKSNEVSIGFCPGTCYFMFSEVFRTTFFV
jgi:hypothetical protein